MRCRPLIARSFWLLPALAGAVLALGAEIPDEHGASSFRAKLWTTDNGLPKNRISCLKQSRDGYLWIGTWNGLVRFDGMRFTVFNKLNTPELASDEISALAEATDGTLWMGTRAGLVSYQAGRFHRFPTGDAMPDGLVWQVVSARDGGLWVQSGYSVARFQGGKFSRAWRPPIGARILSLQEATDGWLNIFTDAGWLQLSAQAGQLRTNCVIGQGETWLAALSGKEQSALWIGTGPGLQRLEQGLPVGFKGLPEGLVDFLYEDRAGNLWVNVQGKGCYSWDHRQWRRPELGPETGTASVICMEEDLEGNIWLGTERGLVRLHRQPVRTYTAANGLSDDNILSVCEGANGEIWLGTELGLSRISDGRTQPVELGEPSPKARILSVWPGGESGVWAIKVGWGLQCWRDGGWRAWIPLHTLGGAANALYSDSQGRLWVGTERGALAFEPGHFSTPSVRVQGPSTRDVRCMLEDREGTFWFGTMNQGLARLRQGAVTSFTERDGLSNDKVWSLLEDSDGALWIGTDNGLTRYRDGKFFAFRPQHGLPENTINCVLADDFGSLWLGGLHGLHRAVRADLNAVADRRATSAQFVTLGTADGMANPETNGGENQPAGCKARDGRLWFPTIQGVVVVDPKMVPLHEPPPPCVIEQVKADNEVVFGRPEPATRGPASSIGGLNTAGATNPLPVTKLPAGHGHVVEFQYTAPTFVAPERARFRYRLLEMDQDWQEETGERKVYYVNLRPGNYRFEVKAANHHGVWSPQPAIFAFSLAPFFWQTWSFYVLCVFVVAGLVVALQAYRLRWQHRFLKSEEQRALANQRARIARDLHDDLGTALTGLALELDVAGREAKQTPPLAGRLSQTAQHTRELAERMREVVWTVNPKCDTVSSLATFLEQQVGQFLRADDIRLRLDFPEDIPELPLGAQARHQLALSVREALTNVVRHARATEVTLGLELVAGAVVVHVKDNGQGFRPDQKAGHGLENMRSRMAQVGGSFDCVCASAGGTVVTFRLPLESPKSK